MERHLPTGCSLTCRDGAVSRVVVKSVKVLAALRTEIKRTWNTEEESHEDSGQKRSREGRGAKGAHTCEMFQELVLHP